MELNLCVGAIRSGSVQLRDGRPLVQFGNVAARLHMCASTARQAGHRDDDQHTRAFDAQHLRDRVAKPRA
jgi:hypothetical protein